MAYKSYNGRNRRKRSLVPEFLLLIILIINFMIYSNRSLQVEGFTFCSSRLPAGFDGCTIVHLSDLHGAFFGEYNANLLAAVSEENPDYIVLTGDLQDRFRKTDAEYVTRLCGDLSAIAPTFYVTGNHEWALGDVRALKTAVTESGARVLTNEFLSLERGGDTIILAGIDDPNGFADQKTPRELTDEIYAAWDDPFWILLAHRNNYFPREYSALGADLVMSGHAHGGLIRLPFTDGLIGVERDLFPSYTSGFYELDGSTLFVSRGLGNSGRSFRIFNRPQVAVLTLTRGE